MVTPSKKRRIITLDEKKKVIDASTSLKKSLKDLSDQFEMQQESLDYLLR